MSRLVPLIVESPGFFGLNTQSAGNVLPMGWATKLKNFVWDDTGRLASRKGSQRLHSAVVDGAVTIRTVFEYIDSGNSKLTIFTANNKIWKIVGSSITEITGNITTPSADDWQFANFNGACVGFQTGHPCIILDAVGNEFTDSPDTQFDGNMVLSAWGRKWTVLNNTLYFSDLLIDNMTGGSSGNFNLSLFWPNGMDEAIALADFNGFLIVFGRDSMIIYQNPDDPNNMTIVEGVDGEGCIARDSVQVMGKDIIFLANSGLRTLGRTLQEKSMPLSSVSDNVRDELLDDINGENKVRIKSAYNSKDGFYLLSLPTKGVSYMFDLKSPNQDGTLKVGKWDIAPTALNYTQGLVMHMALTTGYLSTYTGFADEHTSSGADGTSYVIDFEGVWNDFGQEVSPFIKILKKVTVLAAGNPATPVTFKWAVDYSTTFNVVNLAFDVGTPTLYDGVSFYSSSGNDPEYTYTATGDYEQVKSTLSRNGQVIKIGLTTTIDGQEFSLQRIGILAKIGRIGI